MAMNMDNTDKKQNKKKKNEALKYYIWLIKMELSKHGVVTQSVYVMQLYPSL